jgi:hypothetical protein
MRMTTTTARLQVFIYITAWIGILTPAVLAFKSKHHWDVTTEVLQEATLFRTINGHLLRFQRGAIIEIGNADVDQDDGVASKCLLGIGGPFSDSSNHFDSEDFLDASTKVVDRLDNAARALIRPTPNGASARRSLGQLLHGVQDYYAHSNWVETMPGTDDRLGTLSFGAVGKSVQTCQAPPNTGTYVPFVGFTSGYWFGCGGKDDAQLPPGKCYHGYTGPGAEDHAGTNKDDDGRLGYEDARTAAKEHTRAIINRLLDAEGIAGNLNRTAALMGYPTLAFVIDTTASMTTELPSVKASVQETVNAAIANGDTPGFVLVTFRDEVSEPFITNDPIAFRSAVDALTAGGGGDCPESSGAATLRAVKASVQGSRVITYTDATANDPAAVLEAKLRAAADKIQVEMRATGSCSPIDPAYKDLTAGTGGQLFSVQPSGLSQLSPLTVPQVSGDFEPLLMANGVFSGTPRVFTVPIDWTVRHAVFSIAAEAAVSLTVTRPNGTVVAAGSPGVTIQNVSTGALVAVDSPQPGAWTLTVSGTGEYSVAVSGNTPLSVSDFSFENYITSRHPGFYPIKGQPLSGLPATAVGRVEGTVVPVTFEAISSDGVALGILPLSQGHPDAGEGDYTGTFDLPSQPFRVIARGVDSGTPFQRIVPTLFRSQPVSVFPDTVPEKVTPGNSGGGQLLCAQCRTGRDLQSRRARRARLRDERFSTNHCAPTKRDRQRAGDAVGTAQCGDRLAVHDDSADGLGCC